MKAVLAITLAVAAAFAAPVEARRGEIIQGQASVIDGDTISVGRERIRLHGVDAPERGQRCVDTAGTEFRCGTAVANALDEHIAGRPVACQVMDVDRWGRLVGRCDVPASRSGGITGSMNRALARAGYVYAMPRFSKDYVADVEQARRERRGLFAGAFEDPAEFRRRSRQ